MCTLGDATAHAKGVGSIGDVSASVPPLVLPMLVALVPSLLLPLLAPAYPRVTLGRTRKQAGQQSTALSGHPHRTKRSRILATLLQNESMYNTSEYVHTGGLSH